MLHWPLERESPNTIEFLTQRKIDLVMGDAGVHGPAGIFAGEQVENWPIHFPIITQLLQQPGRKNRITVFPAFPPVRHGSSGADVEIGPLQGNDLAQAQTGRHQQGAVFGEVGGGKQPLQLLVAENLWQLRPLPPWRDRQPQTLPS